MKLSDWRATFCIGAALFALAFVAYYLGAALLGCAGIVLMVGSTAWAAFYGKVIWEEPE